MLSLFGRPGEAHWVTSALRTAMLSLFGRPGEAHDARPPANLASCSPVACRLLRTAAVAAVSPA
jgi:hypothetical protein